MKLSIILMTVFTLNLTATTFGQFSFSVEGEKIRDVFKIIESSTNYRFFYNDDFASVDKIVSLNAEKESINHVLDKLFESTDFTYQIMENNLIVITLRSEQQQGTIKGTVTDVKGTPLVGVTVMLKGGTNGALTDGAGKYTLKDVPQKGTIVFSFVGMETQEIAIGANMQVDIVLKESAVALEEVVVTGYSSQRKKDITGAVSVVDVKSLKSIPSGSGTVALQGQASGVNIINSGAPGSASQIYIRGIGSYGDTRPLVLVDGVEASLDKINSNEIESMQVLKDAGSASIYGVRGSNGVIIVTTKKGKAGTPVVTYDGYVGVHLPLSGNPLHLVNSNEYWKLMGMGYPSDPLYQNPIPDYFYRAPGQVTNFANEGDPAVNPAKYVFDPGNAGNNYIICKLNKSGTDWFHETFKPAISTSHSLSVSGGTDKSKYMLSVNYLNENGTLIESFLKRYSVRINSDFNIGKNIRIGENIYLNSSSNIGYYGSPGEFSSIANIVSMVPVQPVYDISGINYNGSFCAPAGYVGVNPVWNQRSQYNNQNNQIGLSGNLYAEADILRHFTARTSVGGSFNNNYGINFSPTDYTNSMTFNAPNRLAENNANDLYLIWTNTLKYENTFGRHKLTVLAGSEAIQYSGRSVWGTRKDYFLTDFSYLLLQNGKSGQNNSSNAYENRLASLFSRLDYSYNDKYLLGVTVRRDGSSKFGADSRYGLFPSVSLGWRISNEQFMKTISWINDLKIRGSYGELGSQTNVDNANAYTLFNTAKVGSWYGITGDSQSTIQGFYSSRFGNPYTSWEKDIISNIGFDASIMNNKIDLSAEIYKKSIKGLLFPQPLLYTAGGGTPPNINIGDVENTGLDISANYRTQISSDLKISIGANLTHYVNKITSIPGSTPYFDSPEGAARLGSAARNEIGHPIGEFYGYEAIGLFQSDADVASSPTQVGAAPGMLKYRDINGASYEDGKPDGKIDANDRTFFGSPHPKFTYGINLGLNYKNFDLAAVLYGSYGNKVLNMVKYYTYFSYYKWGLSKDLLNSWTPTNTNTDIPRYIGQNSNSVLSSFYMEDGSFLKCRSLVLGYTLPAPLLEKVRIRNFRIYLQALNLFQITKYSGLDPEIPGSSTAFGVDLGNYPNNEKQFLIGVSLSF